MAGLYTSSKRVERDGFLVAFEGEVMSEDEARKRGLLDEPKKGPAKRASKRAKPEPDEAASEPDEAPPEADETE